MAKGRFLNQKLGKRTDRKSQLLKARLKTQRPSNAPEGGCQAPILRRCSRKPGLKKSSGLSMS